MASLQKTIEIIFQGKDNTANALNAVGRNINSVSSKVEGWAQPFANIADGVLKADAAIAAFTVGTMAYSLRQYQTLEDQLLMVKGILQASDEDYERLSVVVKDLGKSTRYTAQEAASGLEFLARAGFTVDESIGALPEVLRLAQASATDLGTAADLVTNIMAGYGLKVSDLSKTNDVLTATFTNSNTNLSELGDAFKIVGPIAKSLGLGIEEVSAILGVMSNAGYKAEMSGTALRNIFMALISPMGNMGKLMGELGVNTEELGIDTASSAAALKSLGVNVKDADGNMRPFTEIMTSLKTGLDKLPSSADRTAAVIEIFGKRGGPQMAALLEQGSGAVSSLESKIKSLGGVTSKIAEEMESGLGGELRRIRSAFAGLTIDIGEQLSSGATPISAGMREVIAAIDKEVEGGANGAFAELFKVFDDFGDDIYKYLSSIAKNIPEAFKDVDFSGLTDALGGLGDKLVSFFGMEGTDPKDLTVAIQTVVDVLTLLTNITTGIAQAFEPYFKAMADAAKGSGNLSAQTAKDFGEIIGGAKAIVTFGAKVALAFNAMDTAGSDWNKALVYSMNGIGIVVDGVQEVFLYFGLVVVETMKEVLKAVQWFDRLVLFGNYSADIKAAQESLNSWADSLNERLDKNEKAIVKEVGNIVTAFNAIPEKKETTLRVDDEFALTKVHSFIGTLADVEDPKETIFNVDDEAAKKKTEDFKVKLDAIEAPKETIFNVVDDAAKRKAEEFKKKIGEVEGQKDTTFSVIDEEAVRKANEFNAKLAAVTATKTATVTANTKPATEDVEKLGDTIADNLKDHNITITTNEDGSLEIIQGKFDAIPDKKTTEMELTGEDALKVKLQAMEDATTLTKARISEASDIIQTKLEWSARLDIAEVEATAQQIEAIAESLGDAWESSGDVMGSAFGSLADLAGSSRFSDVMDLAEDEMRIRQELLDLQVDQGEAQKSLIQSQAAYYDAKAASMRSGQAMITVDGSGLEPELEAFMWRILEAVQVRATEEASEFLLGI